jgi:F-type H+-transporting ATPase subunit a
LDKKKKTKTIVVMLVLAALSIVGTVLTFHADKHETVKEVMRDAVLHETNKISLFGFMQIDPSLLSGFIVTAFILIAALIIRIFVIPKFKFVPGRFQMLLEMWVGLFDGLAKSNSPHRNKALGAYIFAVGSYIFVGTMFELLGIQVISTAGNSLALPAPLANINGAIAAGCFSYLFIVFGAVTANKFAGIGKALKEFSLPVSMTFRLFGALLSGMLTTELVYYYLGLSFVLPVLVGVLFTVLHAVIQAYVLTMLTSFYYGEVTEIREKKKKTEAAEETATEETKAA